VSLFYKGGIGAEIGVQRGYNSAMIGASWPGEILCVDTWLDPDIFKAAKDLLTNPKFHLIQKSSVEAAKDIGPEALDWVYLDADHHLASMRLDLAAWFPKVRWGGIVAGHDYCDLEGDVGTGVIEAVTEFALREHYRVQLTDLDLYEGKTFPTWWFIK